MTVAAPKVFISYRRSDSLSATGRLYDRLNVAYPGMFFRDVSGIGVGVDFTKEIERAITASVALIVVIGPAWATETINGKRRLDETDDFVRLEVSGALKRNIRVIPVLVGGASVPEEEQLPPELQPLRKWNAVRLVEEYYEEGVQRLIDALRPELGEPHTRDRVEADGAETERRVRELRGEAEAALATEDWFAGIQALQAAVSLDPNDAQLSARLRWAHDQHKVELATTTRRSTVRRWTAGAVAAVCISIVAAAALVVWVVRSEFADAGTDEETAAALADVIEAVGSAQAVRPESEPVGAASIPPAAPRAAGDTAPAPRQGAGPGFAGRGRWRMTARENQAMSIVLNLEDDGSFAASMPGAVIDLPLSGGSYAYDDASGMLRISGINNLGAMFSDVIHVFERENDHFHVTYLDAIWELNPE